MVYETAAIGAARSVVGKALSPLLDGFVETWAATSKFGPTIKTLKMELLYAHGMLNNARGVVISNESLEEMLLKLQDLAYGARDALDELDYFRIQDELEGTHETADRGCFRDFIRDSRHTKRAIVSKLTKCLSPAVLTRKNLTTSWSPRKRLRQRGEPSVACGPAVVRKYNRSLRPYRPMLVRPMVMLVKSTGASTKDPWPDSYPVLAMPSVLSAKGSNLAVLHAWPHSYVSGASNAFRTVSKGFQPCCSPPPNGNAGAEDGNATSEGGNVVTEALNSQKPWKKLVCGACPCKSLWRKGPVKKTPKLELDRVDLSKRMEEIVDELQPLCAKVATILNLELLSSSRNTSKHSTTDRPKTSLTTEDSDLYGRKKEMESINKYMEKCAEEELTIIPIVGQGGMGKTTFAQHICKKASRSEFHPAIWICVSASYNVKKLSQEINKNVTQIESDNKEKNTRRFLLVLDDIWEIHEDVWKKLLAPLRKVEARGSVVLFTTRFPGTATKIGTSKDLIIDLNGLDEKAFEEYFVACVFGQQKQGEEHMSPLKEESTLMCIGRQIVVKLKGSPLAAKTVGRLLRGNLSDDYWTSVLESKEWEHQKDDHDIMPALKLSYDYLPFHLQQCVACCALFPEDYAFVREELIRLWIGLEILHESGQNKRAEDIGDNYLKELVMHGFFNKVKMYGRGDYVIHDLLRELALTISSNGCLSICYSNVRSVEVHPSVRHLSIVMSDNADREGGMTDEYFTRELKRLKKRLTVENLQTLLLFDNGRLKGSFRYLFKEVNSLRVLHVSAMTDPVYCMMENFSKLIHLRYLKIGSWHMSEIQLPSTVSRFYHLRILDLKLKARYGRLALPSGISNLVNLHYFLVNEKHHSEIPMVGKLQLLRVLDKFQVKWGQEFNLKEIEPLMEITELGIYNLENVLHKEEADAANLVYKNRLRKLTLHSDVHRYSALKPDVLESLKPHSSLKELSIIGHKCSTLPKWLGSDLSVSVRGLKSLHLKGVEWLDSKTYLWPLKQLNLQSLKIINCILPSLPPIPWTRTLCHVGITDTNLILSLNYRRDFSSRLVITGNVGLILDEKVLAFDNLTELQELTIGYRLPSAEVHLRKLTSLKRLALHFLDGDLPLSSNDLDDVKWQLPVEDLVVNECSFSGKNLSRLLYHFPALSELLIENCKRITRIFFGKGKENITRTSVNVAEQEQTMTIMTTPSALANKLMIERYQLQQTEEDEEIIVAEQPQPEEGQLELPPHPCRSLLYLSIEKCPELTLAQEGGLQGLSSLVSLRIRRCPKFLSEYASPLSCPFPSSLERLNLIRIDIELMSPRGEGFWIFLTQGHVAKLSVIGCPGFFAGLEATLVQNEKIWSQNLQDLRTDDAAALFNTPVCSLFSSSLTKLCLIWDKVVTLTEDHGNALQLLTLLQLLEFKWCSRLEALHS